MKKKTISKILEGKFKDFLKSIDNENVKKAVEENSIITGGCIASMLMQEPVNDFDLYFTNKETTKAVAEYYVAKFKAIAALTHKDGMSIEMKVMDGDEQQMGGSGSQSLQEPGRIKIYIKSSGIAGEKQNGDYQYFESRPPEEAEDYVDSAVKSMEEMDEKHVNESSIEKYKPVFLSANAITLSNKMQIVIRFYGDPDTIHQHYDYTHCTNYWTSKDKKLVLKQEALESLMAKELVYVGSKYPICSMIRTRKFIKRGFTINAGQFLKMAFQISILDLTNLQVLEDQLTGVDAAYFGQLIDSLQSHKEKNPDFKLDYGYLATIIDKIF